MSADHFSSAVETTGNEPSLSRLQRWRGRLQHLRAAARPVALFASGVVAAFVTLLLYHVLVPGPHQLTTREVRVSVAQALASATPPPAFSTRVYQVIQPSLVLVQAQALGAHGTVEHDLGSGVIIDNQGDILTSLHVVTQAGDIQLTFADGTQSRAQVTATQPEHDIAVLHALQPPAHIVPATLGNPNAMRVGDEAYVVGNPLGLYGSMSAGVISGFDRSVTPADGQQRLQGLIQFDAAVNPGNSGGLLLNRDGEVIGIVTGLVNPTKQDVFVGVGFAVPITVAGAAAGAPSY